MGSMLNRLRTSKNIIDKRTSKEFDQTVDIIETFIFPNIKSDTKNLRMKDISKKRGSISRSSKGDQILPVKSLGKWFYMLTHKLKPHEPPEEIAFRTLYIFRHDWQIRIFCLNLCRSWGFPLFFNLLILSFYTRMTANHFLNRFDPQYDIFGIVIGVCLFLNLTIKLIAYGLIGHRNSYLLRSPFNFVNLMLTCSFFSRSMYFFQVLQCFRIYGLIDKFSLTQSFAAKTKIIKKSLLSLSLFAALYLLMIFLFTLFSWLVFYDSMSKYCLPGVSTDTSTIVGSNDLVAEL